MATEREVVNIYLKDYFKAKYITFISFTKFWILPSFDFIALFVYFSPG